MAVVLFPGSNCEQDVVHALRGEGADADYAWHGDSDLGGADAVVLPGGFAHGDYLRTGAIARFSPVMDAVRSLAEQGAPVLGICNGFQILAEAHLVPGALRRNEGLRFLCTWTELVVEDTDTIATRACEKGQRLRIPINHYEGNYTPPESGMPRIAFTYVENPNGAWHNAAGVANDAGNVVGMMPHPERASESWLGSVDGRSVLASLVESCAVRISA
ncbi:MAG TPA: phosphoribosylformylglycinamidine synthase subunit PurQ [Actinomycetota bacterium]|nr:phosphoribosylformylglycinamidine synthase subunit PurQ [Actinomycetota bacterium]